jgi:Protein chain release factor B
MPDATHLAIAPDLQLPVSELDFRASRSGGPGGQHVNTSSTRVEVWVGCGRLALAQRSAAPAPAEPAGLPAGHGRAPAPRLQHLPQPAAKPRGRDRAPLRGVARALAVPKPRKRTRPSRAAKAARVEAKRRRSAVKRDRRRPPGRLTLGRLPSCAERYGMRISSGPPDAEHRRQAATFFRSRLRY